jgi:hypothetical protein
MLSNYPPGVTGNEDYFDAPPMFKDKNGAEIFFGDKVDIVINGAIFIDAEFINFSPGEVDVDFIDKKMNTIWIPDTFIFKFRDKKYSVECKYIDDDEYNIFSSHLVEKVER